MSLRYQSEALHGFSTTVSAASPQQLVPAVAGQRAFIYRLILTLATAAGTVQLQDTSNNPLSQPFQLGVTGGISLDVPFNLDPWWYTGQMGGPTAGFGLGIQAVIVGTGATLGWDVWYQNH